MCDCNEVKVIYQLAANKLSSANFTNDTVHDHVLAGAKGNTSPPPAYLEGNFLCSQPTALNSNSLSLNHYSSSRAHQLTVGSSELLLLLYLSLLSNFPPLSSSPPLIANQPPCKPALHLPLQNFLGFALASLSCCHLDRWVSFKRISVLSICFECIIFFFRCMYVVGVGGLQTLSVQCLQ